MNTNYKITIPPITDNFGKCWIQPDISKILLTDIRAIMDSETFEAIYEQSSCSVVSGIFAGKIWKQFIAGQWKLYWFENDSKIKKRCVIKEKIIFIIE